MTMVPGRFPFIGGIDRRYGLRTDDDDEADDDARPGVD